MKAGVQELSAVRLDAPAPGIGRACAGLLRRDLLLAFRNRQDLANPLLFFVIVATLFPLGVTPDPAFLREAGPGILWVAALLATLLSLDSLFRQDFEDGALEQWLMVPQPLIFVVLTRLLAHWLVTGLPLVLMAPLLGLMLHLPGNQIALLCLPLLVGTPVLSLVGGIGAALTVGLRSGGVLLSLLVLPLYVPVLVFGAGTLRAQAKGMAVDAHLAVIGAMLALALVLAPLAIVAGLRVSLTNG